jgi:glycine/D-amino acid oxidase-like deaminating enzyme
MIKPSYWEYDLLFSNTDVLVVGAGLTGLSAAITLKQQAPKLQVLVVESAKLGTMATTRNAGFLCYGSPSELMGDLDEHGPDQVYELLQRKNAGINRLLELSRKKDVGYCSTYGYELFDPSKPLALVADRLNELNIIIEAATGIATYYKLAPNTVLTRWGFNGFDAAIQMAYEGQLQSAQLDHSLRLYAQNLGVRVISGLEVTSLAQHTTDKWAYTSEFGTYYSKTVLLANNAFLSKLLPELQVRPKRGQVLVTSELPHLKLHGNYHYDSGYYYFRNVGNRLLLGGARNHDFETENSNQAVLNDKLQAHLVDFATQRLLPGQSFTIEHQWSGIMGFTANKKPICRAIKPGLYAAAGMNGMGVAMGAALGSEIAEKLLDELVPNRPKPRKKR